jgi:hypothetical protein
MQDNTQRDPLMNTDPLELALQSLTPVAPVFSRDQLMFAAGMKAAQAIPVQSTFEVRRRLIWPTLALVSTAATVVLAIMLVQRPGRVVIVEQLQSTPIVTPETGPKNESPQQLAGDRPVELTPTIQPEQNYLLRRQLILEQGPEAISNSRIATSGPPAGNVTQRELLQELYGPAIAQPQAGPWWNPWLLPGDRS